MYGEAMKLWPEREISGRRWRESTKRVGLYFCLAGCESLCTCNYTQHFGKRDFFSLSVGEFDEKIDTTFTYLLNMKLHQVCLA